MNRPKQIIAWTGGSVPAPLTQISTEERQLVSYLFHEQLNTWMNFWGDLPDKDTRRIFWSRARGDAHATYRK